MLGFLAHQAGRDDQAVALIQRAIAINPRFAPYHSNLAHALIELGRRHEALNHFEQAIKVDGSFYEAQIGLAILLRENGLVDESIERLRAVVMADPNNALAHANLGYAFMLRGDMSDGWRELEWRFRVPAAEDQSLRFSKPRWKGEVDGKPTILVHAEQGLGDTIQFCRYVPLAAERGVHVVLEVQRPLARLLRSLQGDAIVVARGDPLPHFDYHIPMMSLPVVFETTTANVPSSVPYLYPNKADMALRKGQVEAASEQGYRIGLVWAGKASQGIAHLSAVDRQRSIDVAQILPLLGVPGVSVFSLQKDVAAPSDIGIVDLMAQVKDMADTAALIANLDLVISVDTSVAHLAAAIGKPIWLLDRFNHDWRWLASQLTSPWYPTMRIYRQRAFGDWAPVIADMANDLRTISG